MTNPATSNSPRQLKPGERLAIIAGGGMLPALLAARVREAGIEAIVMRVAGEATGEEAFAGLPCQEVPLEEAGRIGPILRQHGVTHIVLAGEIRRRPRIAALRWSRDLVLSLPSLVRSLRAGDDALLRFVVRLVERNGITVTGAHEWMPDLVTEGGCLTRRVPGSGDQRDVTAAMEAALAIGALDIGQAAIAIGGRAVALEGIEGTDGLLERTAAMRDHGRLAGAAGGVLAKCAKPAQELRVDLPAIGPATVRGAALAGLAGIALESGRTLILEYNETVRLADELNLFIIGVHAGRKS